MMYLSKEANNKDQSLKIQMMLSLNKTIHQIVMKKFGKKSLFWRRKREFYNQKS